jgi:hypothetical protein
MMDRDETTPAEGLFMLPGASQKEHSLYAASSPEIWGGNNKSGKTRVIKYICNQATGDNVNSFRSLLARLMTSQNFEL